MFDIQQALIQDITTSFEAVFGEAPAAVTLQPTRKDFAGHYTLVMFPFLKITRQSPEDNHLNRTPGFGFTPPTGEQMMVEFSSPNTNKPLHLGHLRNNFLGYSVALILEAGGTKVHKVQIINDRGIHICKSMLAWQKFGQGETPATAGIKGGRSGGAGGAGRNSQKRSASYAGSPGDAAQVGAARPPGICLVAADE